MKYWFLKLDEEAKDINIPLDGYVHELKDFRGEEDINVIYNRIKKNGRRVTVLELRDDYIYTEYLKEPLCGFVVTVKCYIYYVER